MTHFDSNPKCTVVVVYSQTNVSKKEDYTTSMKPSTEYSEAKEMLDEAYDGAKAEEID